MRDWILKIFLGFALVNAFGELAIAQIHILAITKVFAKEIGFYLFLFIIFCLVTGFNALLLERYTGIIFFAFLNWITAGAGYIYLRILQSDIVSQQNLTFAEVRLSWLLVVISISICLINSVAIPLLSWDNAKMGGE